MGVAGRIAVFIAGLVAVVVAGYGIGAAVGPAVGPVADGGADEDETTMSAGHDAGENAAVSDDGGHEEGAIMGGQSATQGGYTLVPRARTLAAGIELLAFEVFGPDGDILTDYEVEHEKELHLIAVRQDGAGFQHVHPVRDDAGQWSTELDLRQPGPWRVFADFVPGGTDEGLTLGITVQVAGEQYEPRATVLSTVAEVDGLRIEMAGRPVSGAEEVLEFSVTRDSAPVVPEPYLGARGHLVALREGDLAYLHVHPDADSLSFMATFPTPGRYLLYLDFSVDGQVRTAPFTVDVPA
ncbi:MAG: hypothetical protein ACRDWI_05930 [Jiangellaceae bacterium]